MTNEIIETLIFLIPGFICFEIFYSLSGIDIKLSDKKYYFICLSISFIIYILYGCYFGIQYIQEIDSQLIEFKAILYIYVLCISGSLILATVVRFIWFRNYYLSLSEPWTFFLEKISRSEATEVTVITSDGSEYYGKLRLFTHKNDEQRELILEDVNKIISSETEAKEIDIGAKEILFTKEDIRRIIYNKSTRKNPTFWEKIFHIKR